MDRNSPDRPGKPFFTPRLVANLVMIAAIVVTLLPGSRKEVPESRRQGLEDRNARFVYRLSTAQAVSLVDAGKEEKQMALQELDDLFSMLESRPSTDGGKTGVEKAILENYLGRIQDRAVAGSTDSLHRDYSLLYEQGKLPDEDSPLFELETGKLARLKYLEIKGDMEGRNKLLASLKDESTQLLSTLMLIMLGIFLLFGGSAAFAIAFFFRKPRPLFGPLVAHWDDWNAAHIMDSAILFLFLSFPVGRFLASFFQPIPLLANLVYMPLVFIVVLIIYRQSTGVALRTLFLDERETSVLKEIGWGFLGFVGIFPMAILATMATVNLSGADAGNARFAHPVVFSLQDHPGMIFLFAVFIVPIIEETVFRYMVYGFFRRSSGPLTAGLVSGTIFAILHPQGWIALPYLTILGMGLSLLREYRPGLIAPVVAHGIVNALALGGSLLFFSLTASIF